jgi:hypothetical protein
LVREPEGKRPLGRPNCIWKNNIKMDLKEIGWNSGLDLSGSGKTKVGISRESDEKFWFYGMPGIS